MNLSYFKKWGGVVLGKSSPYLGLEKAAQYLGRSESWLYKRVHRKEIPFLKPDGKLMFIKSDLDTWVINKNSIKEPCISKFEIARNRISSLTNRNHR